jgi:predicted branched-subunit amino acid permease
VAEKNAHASMGTPRKRSSFLKGVRDIVPLFPAHVSYGLVAGAAVVAAGFGIWESVAMSTGIYGAAAQVAALGLWTEAAPPLVIVGTALVINARFFLYSTSIAHVLPTRNWLEAIGLAYFLRDGAYATTMTRAVPDPEVSTKHYYLGAALTDWGAWLLMTSVGVFVAAAVPDDWSLDFIVPLVFAGFLMGTLKSRVAVETAAVAILASIILVPVMPMQTGVLAAIMAGMAWSYARDPEAATRDEFEVAVDDADQAMGGTIGDETDPTAETPPTEESGGRE